MKNGRNAETDWKTPRKSKCGKNMREGKKKRIKSNEKVTRKKVYKGIKKTSVGWVAGTAGRVCRCEWAKMEAIASNGQQALGWPIEPSTASSQE